MGINVLSLCDGMSGGQIALKELGFEVDTYFSFEIKNTAIKTTQLNFPNTIQLGDVNNFDEDICKLTYLIVKCLPKSMVQRLITKMKNVR